MAAAAARRVVAHGGGGSSSLRRLFSSFLFASPQPAAAPPPPPPPAEPSSILFVSGTPSLSHTVLFYLFSLGSVNAVLFQWIEQGIRVIDVLVAFGCILKTQKPGGSELHSGWELGFC